LLKALSQQPFVVVLAQDQKEWIRAHVAPNVTQRDACSPPPSGPHVRTGGAFPELEGLLNDAKVGVDLEGAGLYAQGSGLKRRTRVPIHDHYPNPSPTELVRQHEPGRARSHDQDVSIFVVLDWHL
jgi:hypothetical protein